MLEEMRRKAKVARTLYFASPRRWNSSGSCRFGPRTKSSRYMHLTATTQFGLEELLADELYDLGADITHVGSRAVEFIGDQRLLYNTVLWSRLAMRLLRPFAGFYAPDEKALYREVSRIDWMDFIGPGQTFAITAVVHKSTFEHSLFVAQLTKDAIVDQFRKRTGERPSVEVRNPDIRLHLRMLENEVILSMDAAGDSLHRRGYRQHTNEAPLNEVLAAGLVLLSGWDGKKPLIDPMCGSATILTEAGMMAQRIAPGLFHQGKFGFENWYDFDENLWQQLRKDAPPPKNQPPGLVITNPPYGERIGAEAQMAGLYKTIGDTLKTNFQGYDAFIFTGNLEAAKAVGLKTTRRIPLFNGPIDCRLLKYELYQGSKRAPRATSPPGPLSRGEGEPDAR